MMNYCWEVTRFKVLGVEQPKGVCKSEKEQARVNLFNCFVINGRLGKYLIVPSSSMTSNREGDDRAYEMQRSIPGADALWDIWVSTGGLNSIEDEL